MIIRAKFKKKNYLKYISHLDLMRLFRRSFMRAEIPVRYSEGFNPQPRFSIANPLSLGYESEEEYMDVDLSEKISGRDFMEKMNNVLPEDIQIIFAEELDKEEPIAALISWAYYEIKLTTLTEWSREDVEKIIKEWLIKDEILITKIRKRRGKVRERKEDIQELIGNIIYKEGKGHKIILEVLLKAGDRGNLRPGDFMEALNRDTDLQINMDEVKIKRLSLYGEKDGQIYKP